ncbi:hypothetical protein L1987_07734 [Smallanthus sonchifolius]|uniref:Uncharacterized protein n=1 Tax=Smallanthus sonchifolius TaxID=185202 RepID=A0ACB9K101_9ASTR|nr:hypothetical protein L1987_07734 [Smallanthus sonchifolius]
MDLSGASLGLTPEERSREKMQDDVLPDGTFVKRSRVTYHPYAMGRMERIWGPYSVCLGKELSFVEMKSVALCLVRRFDVRVMNPNQLRFAPGLTATRTTSSTSEVHNFGEPFSLVIHEGETLAEVKARTHKKLQVPDDEFSKVLELKKI